MPILALDKSEMVIDMLMSKNSSTTTTTTINDRYRYRHNPMTTHSMIDTLMQSLKSVGFISDLSNVHIGSIFV